MNKEKQNFACLHVSEKWLIIQHSHKILTWWKIFFSKTNIYKTEGLLKIPSNLTSGLSVIHMQSNSETKHFYNVRLLKTSISICTINKLNYQCILNWGKNVAFKLCLMRSCCWTSNSEHLLLKDIMSSLLSAKCAY